MPINFFDELACTSSKKDKFGICDNPSPAKDPAYIDEINTSNWIAEVQNTKGVVIKFYPIDHCISILKPDGINMESRCDGMLKINDNLFFTELKDRTSSGWLKKGREQLTNTIEKFSINHPLLIKDVKEGYVCNKQFPMAIVGINTERQKFKDDTSVILKNSGLILKADRNIVV